MLQRRQTKKGGFLFRLGEQCRVRRTQVLKMVLVAGPQRLDDCGNEVIGLCCWVVHEVEQTRLGMNFIDIALSARWRHVKIEVMSVQVGQIVFGPDSKAASRPLVFACAPQ